MPLFTELPRRLVFSETEGHEEGPRLPLRPGPFSNPRLEQASSSLVGGGSGLVDPVDAVGRGRGAQLDRGPDIVKLKVVGIPSDLDDVYGVLGIASVGHSLCANALVRVVARLRDVKGLVYVPALSILLSLLGKVATEAIEVEAVAVDEVTVFVTD